MSELRRLVAEELEQRVDPRVTAMAAAIAAKHGAASRAVMFYGSCLRQREFDGLLLDFYLIVSDYRSAYDKRWLAIANRLIPPNVFYVEHGGLAAKYAVLSEADFAHECSPQAWQVSTAARFAQPVRLVWRVDEAAGARAGDAVAAAVRTLLHWALPQHDGSDGLNLWKGAFDKTLAAELRAERSGRGASFVDAEPERYRKFAEAALAEGIAPAMGPQRAQRWWRGKQVKGKVYSVARLAKASATFAGGADYIAWKINRHAGTAIELKPWQRRWPLVAAIGLLPKLIKSGAVR
ncbi:hypothetical protein H9L13_04190 [Sphingomonas lutea]|uniref:Phosphatidate cytidylyltransferase n=1 Tax=Sphingomonas lutea TaxID=1045317 RepID=A0A7G9SJS2_9SPHN|nr:hypothetical protein [Sphingomonas lutea]QNN68097.1 hypothetical protein H9L13_04190 [Sphingomonas lutea]